MTPIEALVAQAQAAKERHQTTTLVVVADVLALAAALETAERERAQVISEVLAEATYIERSVAPDFQMRRLRAIAERGGKDPR